MPRRVRLRLIFAVFLTLESACRNKQAVVPLPPPPATSQPGLVAPASAPASATSQPSTAGAGTTSQEATQYQVNKPAPSSPAARMPTRSPAAPASTVPPAATTAVPPAAPPKLGDVLTADEQKQYSASIDQSLAQAQASLNAIRARPLNQDQQREVEQIRRFMQQAEDSRVSDPAGAKSLAERAKILAVDLAKTFR